MVFDELNAVQVFEYRTGNRKYNQSYYPSSFIFFKNLTSFISILVNQSAQPIIPNINPKSKSLGYKLVESCVTD